MQRIGLIDVDSHNYPNLALMKLSAYHKAIGDDVSWYDSMFGGNYDICYVSKIFSFSKDYDKPIHADKVVYGGSGYAINLDKNGKETFDARKHKVLANEIEHKMPDYSIYYDKIPKVKTTAYGFLTRGCPRNCDFCIVTQKEGCRSLKVANLDEFWTGQKHIELMDANILASKDRTELLTQLKDSGSVVNFSQGLDARLLNEEVCKLLKYIKVPYVHFAWDNYKDEDKILPKIKMFKEITGYKRRKIIVYVIVNFNTTFEQDLDRVYKLRKLGADPYVMIYKKYNEPRGTRVRQLQRWVNNRICWNTANTFEEYLKMFTKQKNSTIKQDKLF